MLSADLLGFGDEPALTTAESVGELMIAIDAHDAELAFHEGGLDSGGGADGTSGTGETNQEPGTGEDVLHIRVDFADMVGDPVSVAQAESSLYEAGDFLHGTSWGELWFENVDVTDTYRMPHTTDYYYEQGVDGAMELMEHAITAALGDGFVVDDYWSHALSFDLIADFGWAGLGWIGAPGIWLNGYGDSPAVAAHEFGHNLGAWHSGWWKVDDGNPLSADGRLVEYGDVFDIMGSASQQFPDNDFNTYWKTQFGWMDETTNVTQPADDGTYRLYAHDAGAGSYVDDRTYALHLPTASDADYWIEYRQAPYSDVSESGIEIRWSPSQLTGRNTALIDTSGAGTSAYHAPLGVGESFFDEATDMLVTPLETGVDDDGNWWVDVRLGEAATVVFEDANLEQAVRDALSIADGAITEDHMLTLTTLDASQRQITSLGGLEYARNLTTLDLGSNDIDAIDTLESLSDLRDVWVQENFLDLSAGSFASEVIGTLESWGATVTYDPQKFANATVTAATDPADIISPAPHNTFTVTYTGDTALDAATIIGNDQAIRVIGPNQFDVFAEYVSIDAGDDPNVRLVTYQIAPPNETWSEATNGTYTVWLEPEQVADEWGNFAEAAQLNAFDVAIDQTAPVTQLQLSGEHGNGSWFVSTVEVTLTSTDELSEIDRTEYRLNGGTWNAYDGSFTLSESGATTLEFRAVDTAGNYESVQSLYVQLDTAAPGATAQIGDVITTTEAHYFTVTYSDNLSLDAATINGNNQAIRVVGPNGFESFAEYVSSSDGEGAARIVTYRIDAPESAWHGADNGQYTVMMEGDQITDTAGNALASGVVGTFHVAVPMVMLRGDGGMQRIQFTDDRGTDVTIMLRGSDADLLFYGTIDTVETRGRSMLVTGTQLHLEQIELLDSTDRAVLMIMGRGGDGTVYLDQIVGDGPLNRLMARETIMRGDGVVLGENGYARMIQLGALANGADVILPGDAERHTTMMMIGSIGADSDILVAADVRMLRAAKWVSGTLEAGSLGNVIIDGPLTDSTWIIAGDVGNLRLNDVTNWTLNVTDGGSVRGLGLGRVVETNVNVEGELGMLRVTDWSGGSITAESLRMLQSSGDRMSDVAGDFTANLTLTDAEARMTLGNVRIAGAIEGGLWDVRGQAGIISAGDASGWVLQADDLRGLRLGSVSDVSLTADAINMVQAFDWSGGAIEAGSIGSLQMRGDRRTDIAGDFSADLTLTDSVARQVLRHARIAGDIIDSTWSLNGSVGMIAAAGMHGSTVLVGVDEAAGALSHDVAALPEAFDLRSISLRSARGDTGPTFSDSRIAAGDLRMASLGSVQTDNAGEAIGITAGDLAMFRYTSHGTGQSVNLRFADTDLYEDDDLIVRIL